MNTLVRENGHSPTLDEFVELKCFALHVDLVIANSTGRTTLATFKPPNHATSGDIGAWVDEEEDLLRAALDTEDTAMLTDAFLMGHVAAAEEAHARARAGEDVDWPSIIRDHIVQ